MVAIVAVGTLSVTGVVASPTLRGVAGTVANIVVVMVANFGRSDTVFPLGKCIMLLKSLWLLVNLNRGAAAIEARTKQSTHNAVARFHIAIIFSN